MPFSLEKVEEIEAHLQKNPYLSEGGLPGAVDAEIYFALDKSNHHFILEVPDAEKTPAFHHWFYFINSFSNDLMKVWVEKAGKGAAKKVDDDEELACPRRGATRMSAGGPGSEDGSGEEGG